MTTAEKLPFCAGCTEDFYNGKNPYNIPECWLLKSATVEMRKRVPIDQRPPWTQKPVQTLSCYQEKGCIYVRADQFH